MAHPPPNDAFTAWSMPAPVSIPVSVEAPRLHLPGTGAFRPPPRSQPDVVLLSSDDDDNNNDDDDDHDGDDDDEAHPGPGTSRHHPANASMPDTTAPTTTTQYTSHPANQSIPVQAPQSRPSTTTRPPIPTSAPVPIDITDEDDEPAIAAPPSAAQAASTSSTSSIVARSIPPTAAPNTASVSGTRISNQLAATFAPEDMDCMGVLEVNVVTLHGLPQQILYDLPPNVPSAAASAPAWSVGPTPAEMAESARADQDTMFTPSRWPRLSTFWAKRGTRPVQLRRPDRRHAAHVLSQQQIPLSPSALAIMRQMDVSLVIPPAWRPWNPANLPSGLVNNPSYRTVAAAGPEGPTNFMPFGSVTDAHAVVLDQLTRTCGAHFEARVPMVHRIRRNATLHPLHTLIFLPRQNYARATALIWDFNMHIGHPDQYMPSNYPGDPPLSVPQPPRAIPGFTPTLPGVGAGYAYNGSSVGTVLGAPPSALGTAGPSTIGNGAMNGMLDLPMTETQQKDALDEVYSTLQHADDVAEIEPSSLIKTPLFPHQKKALGFLMMREKERDFDVVAKKLFERSEAKRLGRTPQTMDTTRVGADGLLPTVEDRAAQDGGTVSLWRPVLSRTGQIKGYQNLVTNSHVKERPQICRGAILADDMGLGKTISVIALFAQTREDALAWSKTRAPGQKSNGPFKRRTPRVLSDSDSDSDSGIEFQGLQRANVRRPMGKAAQKVANAANRLDKIAEQERIRQEHLEIRSRATLIVCPMSVISNWSEQIAEHWGKKDRPKICTYHGSNRVTDVCTLANYDVVLTTYSTLAAEFGNQTIWSDSAVNEVESESSDSDVEEAGSNGLAVPPTKKRKRRRKGKVRRGKEHPNPLQRIEWFRVVLDEAHIIKDCGTWQSRAVCNLSAQRRIVLTGTPIQNAASDLYALIRFLRLDPFADRAQWMYWCNVSKAGLTLNSARKFNGQRDSVALQRIQTIMKFLTMRRTKDSKGPDGRPLLALPPKFAQVTRLPFSEAEKARYLALHDTFKEDFEEMALAAEGFKDTKSKNQDRDEDGKTKDKKSNYMRQILKEITWLRLTCDHADMADQGVDLKHNDLPIEELVAQHGITRDRAKKLFLSWRTLDMAHCLTCGEEIDLGLDNVNGDPYGLEGERANEVLKPVITGCQHLFCSKCFPAQLPSTSSWPKPKAFEEIQCAECDKTVPLLLEAIMLEPTDFEGVDGDPEDLLGSPPQNSDSRTQATSSRTNSGTNSRTISRATSCVPPPSQSKPKFHLSDSDDDNDNDLFGPRGSKSMGSAVPPGRDVKRDVKPAGTDIKPGTKADPALRTEATKLRSATLAEALISRPELSSKILALLQDLIPFSACNPWSKLYDRQAPQLDHVPTPPAEVAKLKAEREKMIEQSLQDQAREIHEARQRLAELHRSGQQMEALHELALLTMKAEATTSRSEAEADVAAIPTVRVGQWMPTPTQPRYQPIKSVVFSQWTRMLDKIGGALERTGIRTARLDGTMSRDARVASLESFKNDPSIEVLLVSLRSGGVGLNLATSSSRAYLVDPAWNPAVEQQALDRIYRLGQARPVMTIKLIMRHSIEENLLLLQARKQELAQSIGEKRQVQPKEQRGEAQRNLQRLFGTTERLRQEHAPPVPPMAQQPRTFQHPRIQQEPISLD